MRKVTNPAFYSFLVFSLLIALTGKAEVRKATSMKEVLDLADADTLVVFDLDNTVMEPKEDLGSDQWFQYARQKYTEDFKKKGLSVNDAQFQGLETALKAWKDIQNVSEVIPVEKETPRWIREKQDRGVKMMGLTARPVDLAYRTLDQLDSIGVNFERQTVHKGNLNLKDDARVNWRSQFLRGILFSGNNKKGPMLLPFLRRNDVPFKPKKILFVDDRKENVDSVEETLNGTEFRHITFRYEAADSRVNGFKKENVEQQLTKHLLKYYGALLSDQANEALAK